MKLWTALVFVISVLSVTAFRLEKRAGSSFIGYRVVSPAEAEAINKAGRTLVQSSGSNSQQLGPGIYLSSKFQDWFGPPNAWDCAILADSAAWNNVNKAWVPTSFTQDEACLPLWYGAGVANRVTYLQSLDSSWTTSNTVLLSEIQGFPGKLQMLIPPSLVSSLTFVVQCAARSDTADNEKLAVYGEANWNTMANTKGSPT